MIYELKYKSFGAHAILIEWPEKINDLILKDILDFKTRIYKNKKVEIQDLVNGYNSLTILYHNRILNYNEEVKFLKKIYLEHFVSNKEKSVVWEIPVCYDEEFGLDLNTIALKKTPDR